MAEVFNDEMNGYDTRHEISKVLDDDNVESSKEQRSRIWPRKVNFGSDTSMTFWYQ